MSTTRRTAGVHSRQRPLGANGEKICYNCGGPLPKGCRFNCSHECSVEWQCKTSPGFLRVMIWKRDQGICALCGVDTIALKAEYDALPRPSAPEHFDGRLFREIREKWLETHGVPPGRASGDFWDADHIVPVVEGGGETGLSNFRTLCIPCHKRETAKLRGRMKERAAEERRAKVPLPLFDGLCDNSGAG